MKRGVVIGKFLPPHRGHKYLIDTAASQVDELFVIVCDKEGQPIPGETRAAWLRRTHPSVNVLVVPDRLPEDSLAWARYTVEVLGFAPDVAFTSEEYGDAYARHMGAEHVLVDLKRKHVPVSATAIRESPLEHWDYLEPCVRGYYAKRVCVVGAESTGTTTMARALADTYRTAWVPEFGRYYTEGKVPGASEWASEEFAFIARVQNELEDQLAERCNRLLVCDTDSFATSMWHERYMGFVSDAVEALAVGRHYDMYFVTDVDTPFVQDGYRDGQHIREWMHQRFLDELASREKPFVVLTGSHEARLQRAATVCDQILSPADAPRATTSPPP